MLKTTLTFIYVFRCPGVLKSGRRGALVQVRDNVVVEKPEASVVVERVKEREGEGVGGGSERCCNGEHVVEGIVPFI